MAATHKTKMLILGSGPAGLTAAIYAARAGLKPLVVHGLQPGGQMTITTDVENYPGFRKVIQGPWLMEEITAQAVHVGTEVIHDIITALDLSERPFRLTGDSGALYLADTLVVATGAQAKWLGVAGEDKLSGKGVSACATCDGFFYRGKKVIVIGGGNTAVEEALYLTNHSEDVTLIHRRDHLRAEKILQDRLFANVSIACLWNKRVERFVEGEGNAGLIGAELIDVLTGEKSYEPTDGAFVAIGHKPSTELFADKLLLDGDGYLIVEPGTSRTAVPGVFAAGDVCDKVYRQAVTAAAMGCMAALDAGHFLADTLADANLRAKKEKHHPR